MLFHFFLNPKIPLEQFLKPLPPNIFGSETSTNLKRKIVRMRTVTPHGNAPLILGIMCIVCYVNNL